MSKQIRFEILNKIKYESQRILYVYYNIRVRTSRRKTLLLFN